MNDAQRDDWFNNVQAESFTELDISAFDKSQGEYHLQMFCNFLKAMGVEEQLADYYSIVDTSLQLLIVWSTRS